MKKQNKNNNNNNKKSNKMNIDRILDYHKICIQFLEQSCLHAYFIYDVLLNKDYN